MPLLRRTKSADFLPGKTKLIDADCGLQDKKLTFYPPNINNSRNINSKGFATFLKI
jgi:hypothetical protein